MLRLDYQVEAWQPTSSVAATGQRAADPAKHTTEDVEITLETHLQEVLRRCNSLQLASGASEPHLHHCHTADSLSILALQGIPGDALDQGLQGGFQLAAPGLITLLGGLR